MIQAVIERLRTTATGLTAVESAEELAALSEGTAPRSGTAFVIPYREEAEPCDVGMGAFRQLVHVQLLVAFVLRRHGDAKGSRKAGTFDQVKLSIEQALAGWAVSPEDALFELVSAQAAPMGNGVSVYVQTWQTSRYLEV